MKKSWLRFGVGMVGAAGIAAASLGGSTLTALASGSFTGFNLNGDGGCHNLNPDLQAHTNALTAVPANDRGYAQIKSVSVTSAAATIDGITEASVTVTLCGAIPAFPSTANGDTGASWYACFSPDNREAIATGAFGVTTGTNPVTGNPTHDGPFPKSQGFKFCAWSSLNAGTGLDYGVAWSDPIDQFTFLDPANLFDGTPATPTITKSTAATGLTSFTMYMPYTWRWTDNGGTPLQEVLNEQVIAAGDTTTAWDAQAWVNAELNLPSPVCVPTTSICEQGIIGLLVPVDFAPGYEQCAAPVGLTGCQILTDAQGLGVDLGVEMDFPVGSIQTCVNPVNPATDNPGVAGPNSTCNVETGFGSKGLPWVYAPMYGRILPGAIVPFDGNMYHPFGLMPDNAVSIPM